MRLLKDISVNEAHALLDETAILVDVREPNETASERIPGAIELPLSVLARGGPANLPDGPTIFLCASGARTTRNSAALAALTDNDAYCMTGGIMAWKRAGYPTQRG
ncbi:MAG: rhodanese-like domain-containing protein [Bauldia sp.]|uniref:rhodanese-like domain-containing protein n=1 Tax=Bauldia sp. TaxID=2575872 RepID=UPI001D5740F3|nr:rhodanese-like domain-containing protein [Bauldia sp.]MCB1495739.1 rhodanese-like domain-containing protein [Bauldia sp.]